MLHLALGISSFHRGMGRAASCCTGAPVGVLLPRQHARQDQPRLARPAGNFFEPTGGGEADPAGGHLRGAGVVPAARVAVHRARAARRVGRVRGRPDDPGLHVPPRASSRSSWPSGAPVLARVVAARGLRRSRGARSEAGSPARTAPAGAAPCPSARPPSRPPARPSLGLCDPHGGLALSQEPLQHGVGTALMDTKCNWDFWTEPQEALAGRRISRPRGKGS